MNQNPEEIVCLNQTLEKNAQIEHIASACGIKN
jgi:hypothetical protein